MAFRMLRESVMELVVLAIIVALGLIMLGTDQGLQSTISDNSTQEWLATNEAVYAIADIPDWYALIILAIVFVALIGIVFLIYRAGSRQT
jgi:hypothetical protein